MKAFLTLASLLLATPAAAEITSAYTDFDLKKCVRVSAETSGEDGESSGVFECPGYGDYVVTFAEGDLRSFVSFGTESGDHCSFRQTFGGFNSVGNKIEWRLKDSKPFAVIQRWTVSYDSEDANKTRSWLVVTKIEADESCHMAYVEGALPGANEKARIIADTVVAKSLCGATEKIILARAGLDWSETPSGPSCPAP